MKTRLFAVAFALLVVINVYPQNQQNQSQPQQGPEPTIKISTQLIQLDAVVTDKAGKVVKGLTKNDFEVFDGGKRQDISFFEFVDAEAGRSAGGPGHEPTAAEKQAAIQGAGAADVHRIFAFVIDDLTMQPSDLVFVRDMLTNFVDNRMQPTDLVAIVRVVGGESLLQQFTTDKDLLRRTIYKLTPKPSALNAYTQYEDPARSASVVAPSSIASAPTFVGNLELNGSASDLNSQTDDTTATLRAFMTLGTAEYLIDGMKELPGRKAMVLVSGGLPALGGTNDAMGNVDYFLNQLADQATRAGVAINTLDIRGLSAQTGVASFDSTPAKSALGGGSNSSFGRQPDPTLDGTKIPFDVIDAHMGLRQLSATTGGIAELNRNDFNKGLDQIVETNSAYYLVAYTPADVKFNGDFRKVEIKVKGGYKVLSRRGYVAREEHAPTEPPTEKEQLLAAIKSPLAKRDVSLDAALFYTAMPDNRGGVGIGLAIDPSRLKFDAVGDKQETNLRIAGFVFDEFGKKRGDFIDEVKIDLTADQMKEALAAGIPYSKTTELPPGIYQIRIAVKDQATGAMGTTSRYIEIPDISRGHLAASSLLIGGVQAGDSKAGVPESTPNRAFSRKQDLRYALLVYNPKTKDGAANVTSQVIISQNGKVLLKEQPKPMTAVGGKTSEVIRIGQFGLSHVAKGRFTLTVLITDTLADKKGPQTMVRATDFNVVD